jgi:hypothetical protein
MSISGVPIQLPTLNDVVIRCTLASVHTAASSHHGGDR